MARPPTGSQVSVDAILDEAERLFAERGFGGIGLAEVAERVGLAKSSLFHHFETKAQLYAAVMERLLLRTEAELTRSLASGGPPVQRLERWLETLVDTLAARPTHARLLLRAQFERAEGAARLPEAKAADGALHRIIGAALRLLREGIADGALRAVSAPHVLHALLGAALHPFATGRFGEELLGRSPFAPSEVRRHKAELLGLLRDGLIAPSTPHARRRRKR